MFAVIRISEVTGIQDVNVPLLDDLNEAGVTLLEGSLKNLNQLSAWSKISGMKMRLGLSGVVDWMWTPLSLTFLESVSCGSECLGAYCLGDE